MKQFTFLLVLVVASLYNAACSSKDDAAPDYSNYTAVSGRLAVSKNGAASYDLTDLKLKITKNTTTNFDVYGFRGIYNGVDGVEIAFYLDPKRTGTGPFTVPWVGLYYTGGFTGSQTLVDNSSGATFSTTNNSFTGTFTGTKLSGRLTQ